MATAPTKPRSKKPPAKKPTGKPAQPKAKPAARKNGAPATKQAPAKAKAQPAKAAPKPDKPKRSDTREFKVAQAATEIISHGGKTNTGSRCTGPQAEKVLAAFPKAKVNLGTDEKPRMKNVKDVLTPATDKSLRDYATEDTPRDKDGKPQSFMTSDVEAALVALTTEVGDKYVWKRKVAAAVVAMRQVK